MECLGLDHQAILVFDLHVENKCHQFYNIYFETVSLSSCILLILGHNVSIVRKLFIWVLGGGDLGVLGGGFGADVVPCGVGGGGGGEKSLYRKSFGRLSININLY